MRRIMIVLFIAILSFSLIAEYSFSQTVILPSKEKKEQKFWGSYLVSGIFGTSYLFDDVGGDKNLFRSQFNLKEGLNVGQISFQAFKDPEKEGFFDAISLDVRGFGAEPYGRAAIRLEKRNIFSLTGGYTERKYFADVASFANPLFDTSSETVLFRSFHTWNTKEKSFDLNGSLKATPWLSFDASWQRTKLEGDSVMTLRLLNNEFPLNEPVNQTSNVFRLGSNVNIKNKVFYRVTGLYQKYDLDQTASSIGENVGIRGKPFGSSAIFLTDQSRRTTVEVDTWALSQSIHIIPSERITIDGSFNKSWADGETSSDESIEGRFAWPFYNLVKSATYANTGILDKDFTKGDFVLGFQLLPEVRLRAGYSYYKYTIENKDDMDLSFSRIYYDRTVSESESSNPLVKMRLNKFFADAELAIGKNWTASAGYAHSTNDLGLQNDGEDEEDYTYKLNSFYGSLTYKISEKYSLTTSLERGDYNNIFARLVPLESTSFKIQGNLNLEFGIAGSLFYRYQNLENSKFSYSSSLNSYGGHVRYQQNDGLYGAFIHYSRNDLDSSLKIFRFVNIPFEIADTSEYLSDTRHISLGFWYRMNVISLNGGYSFTETKGTFPIKMHFPYFSAAIRVISDIAITFDYRFYNHKQINFLNQNYKAHLFNIGFMYIF